MSTSHDNQATRLDSLLKVLPAGVVVLNGKGIVIQSNPQAKVLLGEPLDNQPWRAIIARAFKPRADDGHEVSLTNGKRVKLAITPLEGEPGQLILLTDLTETRQLQARISHMQRLSSLGKMVASLAHQIRTPLSAAMLYASNLTQRNMDAVTRERFSQRMTERLKELEGQVNDMLLFAKSGDQQVLDTLSLSEWCDSVKDTAYSLAQKKDVELTFDDFDLPVQISGNLPALQGALLNLIDNAVQVSAKVNVSASFDGKFAQVSVADNGPGINEGQVKSIFAPFFTTKPHGTGLGLAVVKSVAQSHQGDVVVKSSATNGTIFTLRIPAQRTLSRVVGE